MKPKRDPTAIIVGAGVMGCVLARVLEERGYRVTMYDDRRPGAGSLPSAGVIHPHWVGMFQPDHVKQGLALLDRLYGLQQLRLLPGVVAHQLSPDKFLDKSTFVKKQKVTQVGSGWVIADSTTDVADLVVLCTGSWANELLPPSVFPDKVNSVAGTGFLFRGMQVEKPMVRPWAPYKQLVCFNLDARTVWAGDSTSVLTKNYTEQRRKDSQDRVEAFVGLPISEYITGFRPQIRGQKSGVLREVMSRTWINTGGSKNGTIMSAINALRLVGGLK